MVDNSTIKLFSWNVHGIESPIKQSKILNFLKREKGQIAFIQKYDLSNEEHLKSFEEGKGLDSFHSGV